MPTLEEIKAGQQVMWSSGDYGKIAWLTVPLADVLVEAVDLRPGSKVLDVATGTGHVALAAARRFCEAVGVDYVPALLDVGRRRGAAEGLDVTFMEGDAEKLPVPDGAFDYVLSAIGVMFAPDQEQTARELLRATRPGGTIGMINWTPTGLTDEMFKTIAKHVPPPPGLKPAALWGSEERVRELFGDAVSNLRFRPGTLPLRFLSPEHYADFFLTWYGPILKAAESLEEAARDVFRTDLVALASRFNRATGGTARLESDYTIVIATKKVSDDLGGPPDNSRLHLTAAALRADAEARAIPFLRVVEAVEVTPPRALGGWVALVSLRPSDRIAHEHGVEFIYALRGQAEVSLGGQTVRLDQGKAAAIPAGVQHTHRGDGRIISFALGPQASWGGSEALWSNCSETLAGFRPGPQLGRLVRVELSPGAQTPVHTHPGPELVHAPETPIVLQNEGRLRWGNGPRPGGGAG